MCTTRLLSCISAVLALGATPPARADVVWDEAIRGDLSSNGLAPTVLDVAVGSNGVVGTFGNDGQGVDRDYFSFSVPAGSTLAAIFINDGTFVSGGASFMALQLGPQVTAQPNGAGSEALLGYTHYDGSDVGGNILPRLLQGHPELAGGLPGGSYSMWVQETGGTVSFDYSLQISSVPEPSGGWLWAAGALMLAARARPALQPRR